MSEIKITNEEFDKILEKMHKTKASVPINHLMFILGGVITATKEGTEDNKHLIELLKESSKEKAIEKMVLLTCNSIAINLWKYYGELIETSILEPNKETEVDAA